jgi:protein-disulfide isomerase
MAFRHLPLEQIHPFALGAAVSAECAGRQDRFWAMHDLLFAKQEIDPAHLRAHATTAGLDLKAFDGCLGGQAADRVRQDIAGAQTLGITGTPTFLFGIVQADGRIKVTVRLSGALPADRFRATLDELLASDGEVK